MATLGDLARSALARQEVERSVTGFGDYELKMRAELNERMREVSRSIQAAAERSAQVEDVALSNQASAYCRILVRQFVEFESELAESKEVGLRLVSFGQSVTIHVRDLGWYDPGLIVFVGVTDQGHRVELVQNISQVSFLMMAVPRVNPETPREQMGFHVLFRELFGEPSKDNPNA
jgi:hypothetical protein